MKCWSSNHAFLLLLKFPTSLVFLFIGFFLNNLWHPFIFPWPLFLICFRYPDCFLICMQVQNWDESIARQGWFQECDLDLSGCACRASCRLSILNSSARDHFTMALAISIWLEIWWGSRGMIASDNSQMSEYDSSWIQKYNIYRTAFQTLKHEPLCAKSKTSQVKHWYESVMHLATRCNRLISESNFMTCCVLEIKWADLFLPSWVYGYQVWLYRCVYIYIIYVMSVL